MNLNIHVGYHKTGTTSFQRHLATRKNNNFLYFGRSYDETESDFLINKLSESIALDDRKAIFINYNKVLDLAKKSNSNDFLISHENLLKQNDYCLSGLKYFESLALNDFNVKFFVSTRNLEDLLVSRFIHDLRLIKHSRYFPEFFLCYLLEKSFVNEINCSYPYCKKGKISCHCGRLKKIHLPFYSTEVLHKELVSDVFEFNILEGEKCALLSKVVFEEAGFFPIPHFNEARIKIKNKTKVRLRMIAKKYIENSTLKN